MAMSAATAGFNPTAHALWLQARLKDVLDAELFARISTVTIEQMRFEANDMTCLRFTVVRNVWVGPAASVTDWLAADAAGDHKLGHLAQHEFPLYIVVPFPAPRDVFSREDIARLILFLS